jgi:anti-anti-sigma factor
MSLRGAAELPASGWPVLPKPFRVTAQTERNVVRICPFGEVDIETVGQIREQIEKSTATAARRVVLDLRGATFLDSAGLHLVLEADAASRADGWEFGLIGGPAYVQRVFDLTGSRARLPSSRHLSSQTYYLLGGRSGTRSERSGSKVNAGRTRDAARADTPSGLLDRSAGGLGGPTRVRAPSHGCRQ